MAPLGTLTLISLLSLRRARNLLQLSCLATAGQSRLTSLKINQSWLKENFGGDRKNTTISRKTMAPFNLSKFIFNFSHKFLCVQKALNLLLSNISILQFDSHFD